MRSVTDLEELVNLILQGYESPPQERQDYDAFEKTSGHP